ncbi:MAG: hypothetical protein KA792_08050 [Bacteroidales bacterium]|nr:hypothetical protein [Bacteroidales bacterium]
MKRKNLIKVVLLTVVFLLVTVAIIYPQPPPPPPGPDPPGGEGGGPGIPLQGNLYFLLAAGIAYIAKTGFNIKLRKLFSKKTVA